MKKLLLTLLASAGIAIFTCTAWYLVGALLSHTERVNATLGWQFMSDYFFVVFLAVLLTFLVLFIEETIRKNRAGKST